ncbi:MAG: hypothetical protein U5K28_08630 [Halobacteriales archaeon]|nr:hypothetical protein [Halobacteriales archaeon]
MQSDTDGGDGESGQRAEKSLRQRHRKGAVARLDELIQPQRRDERLDEDEESSSTGILMNRARTTPSPYDQTPFPMRSISHGIV